MSSYKRIPKSLVKKSAEPITISEDFAGQMNHYYDHVEEQGLQKVKEKIEHTEQTMLEELEKERATWVQQAYQEGFEKAKKELEEEIYQQHAHYLQEAKTLYEQANTYHRQIIQQTEQLKTTYVEEAKEEILTLIIACAEKVVHQTLEQNPAQLTSMFDAMLQEITYENKKIYLRVHPKTKEKLAGQSVLDTSHIEFLPDPTLSLIDLVVETEREQLDGRIETQIRALEDALRSALHD